MAVRRFVQHAGRPRDKQNLSGSLSASDMLCDRLHLGTESALWASGAAGFAGHRFGAACHSLPPEAACRQPAVQIRPSASLDVAGMIFAGAQIRAGHSCGTRCGAAPAACFTWQRGLDEQFPSHAAVMC